MDLNRIESNRIESNRIESWFGFVDCGIVSRGSLVRRMIGCMSSLNCIDIVLELKRSREEVDLILYVYRLGRIMVLRTQSM